MLVVTRIFELTKRIVMKNFSKKLGYSVVTTAFVFGAMFSGEALAAEQGTLGATSTGSVDISVKKPARVRISALDDLSLASWVTGDGDVTLTDDVCVYSSRANGGYTIKATGSGTAGAFTLANGTNTLPYSVVWNSGGVGSLANTGTALVADTTSGALTKAARDSSSCNGATPGPTARLVVGMTATDLDSIVDGDYAGTLTMLVSPN